jgi:hypothetical protein
MANAIIRRRAGWWVAGLAVLLATLSLVLLFRPIAGSPSESAKAAAMPRVSFTPPKTHSWLSEQATFYDPTPFFLPTKWNTNQGPLPASVQPQPGQVFPNFGAELTYGRSELALPIAAAESTPQSPADLLKTPARDPFLGFGRADVPLVPLAPRAAVFEITEIGSGRVVHVPNIASGVVLPAGQTEWQPAEFLVCVTAEGLLGTPVETASSDVEDVDVFLRDYLEKTLRLGERLTPGMYRVVIGP